MVKKALEGSSGSNAVKLILLQLKCQLFIDNDLTQ